MKPITLSAAVFVTLVAGGVQSLADSTVHLVWNPSPSPTIAGYYLCWSTNQGSYDHTNIYGADQTNGDVSGLLPGVYFISVKAFDGSGTESDFANVVVFTNSPAIVPPSPPMPTNGNDFGNTNSAAIANSSVATNTGSIQVTNQQSYVLGIPPRLVIAHTNQQTHLIIWGTVDSDVTIQRSTNLNAAIWQTITNLTFTNSAELPTDSLYSQRIYGVLTNAFVPAFADLTIDDPGDSTLAFHRVMMACDYPILADKVLTTKGYATRLISVRMPGVTSHDACYVASENGFIDCMDESGLVRFEGTQGPKIRQIADALADSVSLHWTSASEFIYTNGVRLLEATVVETDPPSSDPVAGQSISDIKIDF